MHRQNAVQHSLAILFTSNKFGNTYKEGWANAHPSLCSNYPFSLSPNFSPALIEASKLGSN
jgi:hypothetical protein